MLALLYAIGAMAAVAAVGWALAYRRDLSPAALERDYADGASRFVEVDGLRFHYRDQGNGEPVVLLHGLTDSLFVWDAWAALLADRFRVIRLDLPGHGLTGPDPARRYDWQATAELVVRFLDRLGIARASLVGSSFGGAIAWHIAASHPDRVRCLVLMAPVAYTAGGPPPLLLRLLAHPLAGPLLARLTPRRAFADRVRQVWADPSGIDPAMVWRQYRLFRRAGNRAALSAILRAGGKLRSERLLHQIRAPTLILWGAADPVLPPANARRLARDIQAAEVVMIQGAGHAPMLERPEESLAAVRDFLTRCGPPEP